MTGRNNALLAFLIRRVLHTIPILLVVLTATFFIVHLTPGDPASVILGEEATKAQIADLRESMGLNAPIAVQYFTWLFAAVRGDLGDSVFMGQPVTQAILSHIGPTIALATIALLIGILIAIPLGITAARKRGTATDQTIMTVSLLGISVPSFLLGLFFALIFGVWLGWLPVAGYGSIDSGLWNYLKYLIMPAVALGAMQAALLVRMTRSSMLDTLNKEYIKVARAKGTKERTVIYRHALKNAFLPILTVIGQSLGGLITGAVVVETIFNVPGIGQLIINSVERRDFPTIQGTVLFVTVAFVFVNVVVDILYGVLDPRVRLA